MKHTLLKHAVGCTWAREVKQACGGQSSIGFCTDFAAWLSLFLIYSKATLILKS